MSRLKSGVKSDTVGKAHRTVVYPTFAASVTKDQAPRPPALCGLYIPESSLGVERRPFDIPSSGKQGNWSRAGPTPYRPGAARPPAG